MGQARLPSATEESQGSVGSGRVCSSLRLPFSRPRRTPEQGAQYDSEVSVLFFTVQSWIQPKSDVSGLSSFVTHQSHDHSCFRQFKTFRAEVPLITNLRWVNEHDSPEATAQCALWPPRRHGSWLKSSSYLYMTLRNFIVLKFRDD